MTLKDVRGYRYIVLESFIGHLRRMLSWQILSIDTTRLHRPCLVVYNISVDQLASIVRYAQLTCCFSAVAELLV